MKQIKILKWIVEIDVEKTEEFYQKASQYCDCLYCENFRAASKRLDIQVSELFNHLGIDTKKPSLLSEFGELNDGIRLYAGSYHLVGELVEGPLASDSDWNEINTAVMENFTFTFNQEFTFIDEEMPEPILQLDFEAKIPWILIEKPE